MSSSARPLAVAGLRPGDRVALVATAGPSPEERLLAASRLISSWGLEPVVYPSATAIHPRAGYLSGPDDVRARDLQDAWCDESIAGIFCIRGGYGSVRILDLLDAAVMRSATPKPLYGSSDVTAVHEWIREHLGVSTWFTPMLSTMGVLEDVAAAESLRGAVFEDPAGRRWSGPEAHTLVPGEATGTLIGGNLSLLAMTIGARTRPVLDNADTIALLEDVTEETYKIDGYLHALLRAGWFDGVRGVALGSWQDCSPIDEIEALCVETLAPLGIPLIGELGFGHGPGAASIPLGVRGTVLAPETGAPQLILG